MLTPEMGGDTYVNGQVTINNGLIANVIKNRNIK